MKSKKKLKNKYKKIIMGIILSISLFLLIDIKNWHENVKTVNHETPSYKQPVEVRNPYDEVSSSINDIGTTKERLKNLSKKNLKVEAILNNYKDYPESLLDMLSRNDEMVDFVLEYPKKKGKTYKGTVSEAKEGEIPLLLQWDKNWGYAPYGSSSIAISGCGPTALSMVAVGLTSDHTITPYKVAKMAESYGYYVEGVGTSWALMTEGCQRFGIHSKEISLSKEVIYNTLKKGQPIICSMRRGDFTTTGHFIVLTKIEDGKIKVHDPSSIKRSNLLWEYERLEGQIKNLWAFYK